jgi:acetoin utilization deacetylase AcuC-like enzyme
MRPHRARLTHSLVENYGLVEKLKVYHPVPQEAEQIAMFHADGTLLPSLQYREGISVVLLTALRKG